MTTCHKIVHIVNIDGVDEMNSRNIAENFVNRFTDNRTHMNRINYLNIRVRFNYITDCEHNVSHGFTIVFTSVCSHKDCAVSRKINFLNVLIVEKQQLCPK